MRDPRIDLVVDADCPNGDLAREHLRRALGQCGLPPVWREWRRDVDFIPETFRDAGSPSIFVDGADVGVESPWSGRSCRLYPAPDGGFGRAPAVETIVQALRRAAA